MKNLLSTLLIFCLLWSGVSLAYAQSEVDTFTGLWVVRFNLASPDEIDKVVAAAHSSGISILFAQVCGRAEAYYKSSILPTADGVLPGFDPLSYLLSKAHAQGIAVHIWVNAFTAANRGQRPNSPEHIVYQHPEWIQTDLNGRSLLAYAPTEAGEIPAIFLDPGVPGVKEYVAAIVREIVDNYPVDGVHLDYVRYPETMFGYSTGSRESFQHQFGWDPLIDRFGEAERQSTWDEWRRQQVTDTVDLIGQVVDQAERSISFSAAVVSNLAKAKEDYFQDWPSWLALEKVDFVVPMAYFDRQDLLETALDQIVAEVGTIRVYPGLAAYKLEGRPRELASQIEAVRTRGFQGMVLFEYRTMAESGLFRALN